jgi:hypothetical protein
VSGELQAPADFLSRYKSPIPIGEEGGGDTVSAGNRTPISLSPSFSLVTVLTEQIYS